MAPCAPAPCVRPGLTPRYAHAPGISGRGAEGALMELLGAACRCAARRLGPLRLGVLGFGSLRWSVVPAFARRLVLAGGLDFL